MCDSDRKIYIVQLYRCKIYIVQQYRCKIYVKLRLFNFAEYEMEDQLRSQM